MRNHPDKVAPVRLTIGSVTYPALTYQAGPYAFIVMFDPQTRLPARIRTLDYDNIWGDSTYDLTLADWRTLGGVQIATSQHYELNGKVVIEIKITDVHANAPLPTGRFEFPPRCKAPRSQRAAMPISGCCAASSSAPTSIPTTRASTRVPPTV